MLTSAKDGREAEKLRILNQRAALRQGFISEISSINYFFLKGAYIALGSNLGKDQKVNMVIVTKISRKWQVLVPRQVRDNLSLRPGSRISFEISLMNLAKN